MVRLQRSQSSGHCTPYVRLPYIHATGVHPPFELSFLFGPPMDYSPPFLNLMSSL